MSQLNCEAQDPKLHVRTHSHNLSVNSVSSIPEPTTPPTVSSGFKWNIWDSHKMHMGLILPHFNLNDQHTKLATDTSGQTDTDSVTSWQSAQNVGKIDKEYLASIAKVPLSLLSLDIPRLAKDQFGCRFLQKRIDPSIVSNAQTRKTNLKIIFAQCLAILYDLIIDPFGNYLVQRLIDYCSESDLDFILESLSKHVFLISVNQHGTRALQKIIEKMSTESQLSFLVEGLGPYIVNLIKDLNGNHVIQKILNRYPPERCQFIYDSIIANVLVVATHKHGCCVLQKCLNHVNADQLAAFAGAILQYETFVCLANDQFGNYVLQYLISINSVEINYRLFHNLVRHGISDLCNLKFSSNVIEKLMKNCFINEPNQRAFSKLKFSIVQLILASDINTLINDPYGNYVTQTLIDVLINPKVNYYVELSPGSLELLTDLKALLGEIDNPGSKAASLQAQIIRVWFGNCKIVSSFGKRIQLKIATIMNANSSPFAQRTTLVHPVQGSNCYNKVNHEFYNKNGHSRANNLQKRAFVPLDRFANSPLLELTAQNTYNYRAHPGPPTENPALLAAPHQYGVHNIVHHPNIPSGPDGTMGPYSTRAIAIDQSSSEHCTPSPNMSRCITNFSYHGFAQPSSGFFSNDYYSVASTPVPRASSPFDTANLAASASNLSLNAPSYVPNTKLNGEVARQDVNHHGRSNSQSSIGFSNTW